MTTLFLLWIIPVILLSLLLALLHKLDIVRSEDNRLLWASNISEISRKDALLLLCFIICPLINIITLLVLSLAFLHILIKENFENWKSWWDRPIFNKKDNNNEDFE